MGRLGEMMEKRNTSSSKIDDDEMSVVLGKFGEDDEENESTLLDQYERLSFEVHLRQAILGRSLSEPSSSSSSSSSTLARTRAACSCAAAPRASIVLNQNQGIKQAAAGARHRKSRFQKVVRKLIKPFILGSAKVVVRKDDRVLVKDNKLWKAFNSRSVRGV